LTSLDNIAIDIQNKILAVDQAEKAVEDAQIAIDDANTAVKTAQNALDDAKIAVADAQTAVDDAKNSVAQAQKKLDDALTKKTDVIAPFDGIIISVKVAGGDEVLKGRVACTIADPNKFESYVMVSEMDIGKVKQDGVASVQIDSINSSFPARVTRIAPSATVQSGVVNFRVKVELDTSATTAAGASQLRLPSGVAGQTGQGLDPATMQQRLQQAVTQGRITQEQLNQFQQRLQQGAGAFPPRPGQDSGQTGQAETATAEKPQLREGLTATINILVDSRRNVVLLPSKAITRQGGVATVQVVKGDTTETRQVKTGLTDYQNTEITEGVVEGEQVVYTRSTSTSTSSSQQRQSGTFFMPGPGPQPVRK
jgi:biotin carboxyl carrier protein